MASDGYWKGQFLTGSVDVVAAEIMRSGFYLDGFLTSKGPEWLGSMAVGEKKESWAEPVVVHMGLVQNAVDRLAKGDGMVDHIISEGLGVTMTTPGPRFDHAIGRFLDSEQKKDFPRLWSYTLQSRLNEYVGKAIIGSKWWNENYRKIVGVRRNVAMVGGIMDS